MSEAQRFTVWVDGFEDAEHFQAHGMSINAEARTLVLTDQNGRPVVAVPLERVKSAFRNDTMKAVA